MPHFHLFLFLFYFIFISYFWLWLEVQKCQLNISPDVIKIGIFDHTPSNFCQKVSSFYQRPHPFLSGVIYMFILSWKYILFKGARFLLRLFAPKIRYVMKNASWQGVRREKEIQYGHKYLDKSKLELRKKY